MLIRHKLVLLFIVFSGVLLCLFSVYIYVASATSRKSLFLQRIKEKAYLTRDIYELHDKVAEKIIISLPEQSEYVFDEKNRLIFAINDLDDFQFNSAFFKTVHQAREYSFTYKAMGEEHYKEGYAFTFGEGDRKRTIAITAYNKNGFDQLRSLGEILVFGNLFFLVAVGFAAAFFSKRAFRPINDLVFQAETAGHDLNFRLSYKNKKNEVGIIATSFNSVLDRFQSLVESQRSFISYASHELRTPLAAINGILETSLNYDKDKESMTESLKAAHKEIQKAAILVNGLLQLAKIESPREREAKVKLNIIDLLLDVISFYKLKNPQQEFAFDMHGLSQGAYIEVNGYPQFLRTALLNVIDNASKYSSQQKIDIMLSNEKHKLKIRVIDKGIGIGTKDKQELFNVFQRGENVKGIDGFGLGLSLTQKIINLHDGEIRLLQNPTSGVTAEIVLPATVSNG
jgi:signal transduction histidine kinase